MANSKAEKAAKQKFEKLYFSEEFLRDWRAELCHSLNLKSVEELPALFRMPLALPAEIGTFKILKTRYEIRGDRARKNLSRALWRYFSSDQYAEAILTIETRRTLEMKESVPVNDYDRKRYRKRLKRKHQKRKRQMRQAAAAHSGDGAVF